MFFENGCRTEHKTYTTSANPQTSLNQQKYSNQVLKTKPQDGQKIVLDYGRHESWSIASCMKRHLPFMTHTDVQHLLNTYNNNWFTEDQHCYHRPRNFRGRHSRGQLDPTKIKSTKICIPLIIRMMRISYMHSQTHGN